MSKSKGNVLDPIDLIDGIELEQLIKKRTTGLMNPKLAPKIEKATRKEFPEGIAAYGTDALRFTYYSLASTGRDINFDVGRIAGFRNFCNKLWNASAYVIANCEGEACGQDETSDFRLSLAERWIISRLQAVEAAVNEGFASYRLDLASQALYDFVWKDYCDWYIELSKPALKDDSVDEARKTGTRRTLVRVLETILRLAHPMMPFITEEIWQKLKPLAGASGDTIMLCAYPVADSDKIDPEAEADIEWLKSVIIAIRNIRGEMNISPAVKIPLFLANGEASDLHRLEQNRPFLAKLAGLDSITWLNGEQEAPLASTALVGSMEVLVPLAGFIDQDAELARLDKEQERLRADIQRTEAKLANPNFAERAPAEVVQKERDRLAQAQNSLAKLAEQRQKIADL